MGYTIIANVMALSLTLCLQFEPEPEKREFLFNNTRQITTACILHIFQRGCVRRTTSMLCDLLYDFSYKMFVFMLMPYI